MIDGQYAKALGALERNRSRDQQVIPLLTFPQIDLIPGTLVCLHLPKIVDAGMCDWEPQLSEMAGRQSKSLVIARLAVPHRGVMSMFRHETSAGWLATEAGISIDEADEIISRFGIRIGRLMCQNAYNPCRFLGVAAALGREPDVLVYETSGMDPNGVGRLHQYLGERGAELCAVHLSYPAMYGTGESALRCCPPTARCLEFDDNR